MITITNISKPFSAMGEQTYEICVTNRGGFVGLATFTHRREDGMATCLLKASQAIENKNMMETMRLINEIQELNGKGG